MGNALSMGKSSIEIELDSYEFFAGSTITGRVHMSIAPQDGGSIENIDLIFHGYQRTEFTKKERKEVVPEPGATPKKNEGEEGEATSSFPQTEEVLMTYHSSADIIRLDAPLLNNYQVMPGNHTIPFSLHIPRGLPSSMTFAPEKNAWGESEAATIGYKLTACIRRRGYQLENMCVREVYIRSPPIVCPETDAMWAEPKTIEITQMCCIKGQGQLTCGASAQRPVIDRGEKYNVSFALKNISKRKIDKAQVTLIETVRFTGPDKDSRQQSHVTATPRGFTVVPGSRIPGSEGVDKKDVLKSGKLDESELYKEVYDKLVNKPVYASFKVDNNIQDTIKTPYIQVSHQLMIEFKTAGFGTKDPKIFFNVTVGPRQEGYNAPPPTPNQFGVPYAFVLPQAPQGWAPQFAPAVVCAGSAIFGGNEVSGFGETRPDYNNINYGAPKLPPAPLFPLNSVEYLVDQLQRSMDPFNAALGFCLDPANSSVLERLTPQQYATILGLVNDIGRIKLARMLAVSMDRNFSLAHITAVLATVRMDTEARTAVVMRLAPLADDRENKQQSLALRMQLTPYELVVCDSAIGGRDQFAHEDEWKQAPVVVQVGPVAVQAPSVGIAVGGFGISLRL